MEISSLNYIDNNYSILSLQNDALTPVKSTAKISEIEAEANKQGFSAFDYTIDDDNDGSITSEELNSYFEFAQNFVSRERGVQEIQAKTYNDVIYNNAVKSYNAVGYNNPNISTFSLKV